MNSQNQIKFTRSDFAEVENYLLQLLQLYKDELTGKTKSEFNLRYLFSEDAFNEDSFNFALRLNTERNFIINALLRLNDSIEDAVQPLIVWDIDKVLGRNNQTKNNRHERHFEIRPAIPPLFRRIRQAHPNIKFGVLTDGAQEHLHKVIFDNEKHPFGTAIEDYFDKDLLFSVRKYIQTAGLIEENYGAAVNYIKETRTHNFEQIMYFDDDREYMKSVFIVDLQLKHPDWKIIPIDDLTYPKYFKDGIVVEKSETYTSIFERVQNL